MATTGKNRQGEELQFEIIKELGVLSEGTKGWRREANIVVWENSGRPKLDIRDWNEDRLKMARGITLNRGEAEALRGILNALDLTEVAQWPPETTAQAGQGA